jgi:tellurite methyltransferase
MSRWRDWNAYAALTKGKPPRQILTKAVPLVKAKEEALDLGAGALNDAQYLLSEGFAHVTALDKEPVAQAIADTLPPERFSYVISGVEDFNFPKEKFDLVNAQFSLPFVQPEHFNAVWDSIGCSLKPGGIFTGQLFGDRDEWVTNSDMTFQTKEQAEMLLSKFDIVTLQEEEKDKATAAGVMKHWHIFHFIIQKL